MKKKRSIWYIEIGVIIVVVFLTISWKGFEWRNPICNEMAFYKHFISVITWKKLPQYQR